MKSLDARFKLFEAKPERRGQSTLIVFMGTVKDAGFSETTIRKWFNKLVDKDDYARKDREGLVRHAVKLSNPVRR